MAPPTTVRSRIARVAVALLAALAVAACSGEDVPEVPDVPTALPELPSDLPTALPELPSALPTDLPLDTNAQLPAGFPVPPGATVGEVVQIGEQTSATIAVPSAQEAYDFYLDALPGAGYTVDSSQFAAGAGGITISGGGLQDGQLGFVGDSVAVQLDPQ